MNPFEAQALRDRAATKTLQRIRWDRERASAKVRPVVGHVEKHLFEPGLTYEQIREACRIRDNNRTTLFRQELGLTPAAYVRDCRMEVACRLLRDTDLEVNWIAELVGYQGPQVFTPAFRRYAGVTPTWYRRRERAAAEAVEEPADDAEVPDVSPSAWRRFVSGELEPQEAGVLLRHFLDRYPEVRRRLLCELVVQLRKNAVGAEDETKNGEPTDPDGGLVPSLRAMLDREDVERLMAEAIWEEVRTKPWAEQLDLVRHHLRFSTPALFHLLGEKSREEGRLDRQVGIRVARLALESASALGDGAAEDGCSPWTALAWAWLGNAKRLALDYPGAEKAFVAAERRLPAGEADPQALLVRAELYELKASLFRDQRRIPEALELENLAIPIYRSHGTPTQTAKALAVRSLVHRESDELAAAVHDLEEAQALCGSEAKPYLRYAIFFNLARCRLQMGNSRAAADALAGCRRLLSPKLPTEPSEPLRFAWLEALFATQSGALLEAREQLAAVRQELLGHSLPHQAALAAVDLAFVLVQLGEQTAATTHLTEALPLLEALELHREANVAEALLRECLRTAQVDVATLQRIRTLLIKAARQEPTLGLDRTPH